MNEIEKKILIIAAHPDDEILGCGGTIARMINEGSEVFSCILSEGIASRDEQCKVKNREEKLKKLKNQMSKANSSLGIKKVFSFDLPDNKFDSVPLLDIVKKIEKIKEEIKPEIIFTHYRNDLNIDHKITYQAVITATRPMRGETVKTIYSFEIPSSTEWNYPSCFNPNIFFDISQTFDKKIKAISCYKSELREFPHPRSLKAIELNAKTWGFKVGLNYVEAFKLVRSIIKK